MISRISYAKLIAVLFRSEHSPPYANELNHQSLIEPQGVVRGGGGGGLALFPFILRRSVLCLSNDAFGHLGIDWRLSRHRMKTWRRVGGKGCPPSQLVRPVGLFGRNIRLLPLSFGDYEVTVPS